MIEQLLRQYEPHELTATGYPWPWDHGTTSGSGSERNPLRSYMPIKDLIREQAGHRCLRCGHPYEKGEHSMEEDADGALVSWSPCDEKCSHPDVGCRWKLMGEAVWLTDDEWRIPRREHRDPAVIVEAAWRILTVHHLDEDKGNCRWWNLAALCQRCHLRMQRAVVMGRPYHFEHSEWFKPFAAGFYAFKYLGQDLDRAETLTRIDELLALEHRFTQEAIF